MLYNSIYERYSPAVELHEELDASALCFVFDSNKLCVKIIDGKIVIPRLCEIKEQNIEITDMLYLGRFDEIQCCCFDVNDSENMDEAFCFRDLRSMLTEMEDDLFLLSGRAFQIMNWNRMSKYCGRCGATVEIKTGERAKVCPNCGSIFYPRISPAVIVAVIKDNEILLAHNKNFRNKWYSVIAGFTEPGETFEDCVRREIMEEVGIRVKDIKYFGSQPWPFPDSLMVGFTAEYDSGEVTPDGVEIDDAGWFSRESMPETPSGYSIAGKLIGWFLEK